jgi:hypothetical protein
MFRLVELLPGRVSVRWRELCQRTPWATGGDGAAQI